MSNTRPCVTLRKLDNFFSADCVFWVAGPQLLGGFEDFFFKWASGCIANFLPLVMDRPPVNGAHLTSHSPCWWRFLSSYSLVFLYFKPGLVVDPFLMPHFGFLFYTPLPMTCLPYQWQGERIWNCCSLILSQRLQTTFQRISFLDCPSIVIFCGINKGKLGKIGAWHRPLNESSTEPGGPCLLERFI